MKVKRIEIVILLFLCILSVSSVSFLRNRHFLEVVPIVITNYQAESLDDNNLYNSKINDVYFIANNIQNKFFDNRSLKSNYWYLLNRLLLIISTLLVIYLCITIEKTQKAGKVKIKLFPLFFVLIFIVIFFLGDLALFKFDYSYLGAYKRHQAPAEKVILNYQENQCTLIGEKAISPICYWSIYSSGLNIVIFGYGNIFISLKDMIKTNKLEKLNQYYLYLKNPEFRYSKIRLPNEQFFDILSQFLSEQKSNDQKIVNI